MSVGVRKWNQCFLGHDVDRIVDESQVQGAALALQKSEAVADSTRVFFSSPVLSATLIKRKRFKERNIARPPLNIKVAD